jgi:heme/copper-type cytochrome/quinol oxidase subunit 3
MKRRPVSDAAGDQPLSHRAPIWWGNAVMLTLEGAGFAILIVTYFYIRRSFNTWPPSGTLVPDLGVSTLDVAILVVSVLPMWYVAKLVGQRDSVRMIGVGLLLCVLFGVAAATLRILEFSGVHTRWNANAYGAIVWSILAVHLAHIIAATVETLILSILALAGHADETHFAAITANAVYWYFVALSWVGLYAIVFLSPRFL